MGDREPVAEVHPGYSSPDAQPIGWPVARSALREAEVCWLSTVRPDGRPHVTPLLAVWDGGALYFTTGANERKAHNLRGNDHCVMTTGTGTLDGLDLVIEGTASLATEQAERDHVADAFVIKYARQMTEANATWQGLPDAIRAGHVLLYRIDPAVGFAFAKGAVFSQTRYRFSPAEKV